MRLNWISDDYTPKVLFLAGLLACLLPYYIIPLSVPIGGDTYDANAIASISYAIATGNSIFQYPDPAFRYLPQAISIWLTMQFQNVTHDQALWITKHYTIFIEGFATPLALFWTSKTIHSWRTGVASLFGLALIQFPFVPWVPMIGFPAVIIDIFGFLPAVCEHCRIAVTGYAQTFAKGAAGYWHYAYSAPWVVLAMGLSSRDINSTRRYILIGVVLGIIFNLEVIQAALTALAVGIHVLLRARTARIPSLITVTLTSIIASAPTFTIIALHPAHYFGFGWTLINSALLLIPIPIVTVLIYAAAPDLGFYKSIQGIIPSKGVRSYPTPLIWSAVLLSIAFLTLIPGEYKIYTQAFYLHKFVFAFWIGEGLRRGAVSLTNG